MLFPSVVLGNASAPRTERVSAVNHTHERADMGRKGVSYGFFDDWSTGNLFSPRHHAGQLVRASG